MLRGLGAEGQTLAPCTVGDPNNPTIGTASLSNVMGGFTWGMSSWLGPQATPTDAQIAATLLTGGSASGGYSFSGFTGALGNNLSAIFDPTVWVCNPSWGIGHLIPPLAVVLVTLAVLKRGRR